MNLNESLAMALGMEREGYAIYMEAAKKTKNKLGKATFEAVAAKEIYHIKAIEDFIKGVADKKITLKEDLEHIRLTGKIDYIQEIMGELKSEIAAKVQPDSDLNKAYQVALKLETNSYDLYKKLYAEAKEPLVKELFHFLMQQENIHFELFQETLEYLDHPGDWFREQERWIIEG